MADRFGIPEGCDPAKRYTSHGFLGRYGTIVDVRSGLVNLTLTSEIFNGEGQLCSMLPEQAERLAAQLLLCAKKLRRADPINKIAEWEETRAQS